MSALFISNAVITSELLHRFLKQCTWGSFWSESWNPEL